MENIHETDVVQFPFQPIDAAVLIGDFFEQNDESLRAAISDPAYIDGIYASLPEKYAKLTKAQLAEELYLHEVYFVEHMLTRLCEILNGAQKKYGFDNAGVVFNINTSLLYDVDETIGGRYRDRGAFHIRPAAVPLFAYLRNNFNNLKLGIISTRDHADLQRQLEDKNAIGSIAPIKPYINGEVRGIYSVSGFTTTTILNKKAFDARVFPDFQPENDAAYIMDKMGVSDSVAQDVLLNQFPILLNDAHELALLEYPNLWVDAEEKLEDFVENNPGVFPGLIAIKWGCPILNLVKCEVSKKTRQIAEYIDSHGDEDPSEFLTLLARDIAAHTELGLSSENQNKFVPTVLTLLRQSFDTIINIDENAQESEQVVFPDNVVTKIGKLEFMAHRRVSVYESKGPVTMMLQLNYVDGDNSSQQLRRHVFNKGGSLLIENPEFIEKFRNVSSEIKAANSQHQNEFTVLLAEILGAAHMTAVPVSLLQRISACIRELDEGTASVAVAIDNARLAAKLDELFQGKLVYNGEVVDPVALFKMPESYRGRIFLIYVGAEYSKEVIHDRIEKLLAA